MNSDGSKFGKTVLPAPSGSIPNARSVYKFYPILDQHCRCRRHPLSEIFHLPHVARSRSARKTARRKSRRTRPLTRPSPKPSPISFTARRPPRKPCAPVKFCSAAISMASPRRRSTTSSARCPPSRLKRPNSTSAGLAFVDLLIPHAGLCPSKGQARKDVEGGGAYINNVRESNPARAVTSCRSVVRQACAVAQRQKELRRGDGKLTV